MICNYEDKLTQIALGGSSTQGMGENHRKRDEKQRSPQKPGILQPELRLELQDTQWPLEYTDHDRLIARAIVTGPDGMLYFIRADRDDEFGKAVLIETSGGGVEPGEDPAEAVIRELKEELGAEAEVICRLGVVSDYYNLIHRHNINTYFLCRALSFGEKNQTDDEREKYHLSTLKLSWEEAAAEYERRADTKLGRLIAARELPVLRRAEEIYNNLNRG